MLSLTSYSNEKAVVYILLNNENGLELVQFMRKCEATLLASGGFCMP